MFSSLSAQLFKSPRVRLDNFVFRLHYRVTVGLLLACAVALLWKITYLSPITCISSSMENGATRVLNDHCWYNGLYTLPEFVNGKVGVDVPAPGVGISSKVNSERTYHDTHRWVVIAVLVQAMFFFIPRIIWRAIEGRQVHKWMGHMDDARHTDSPNMLRKQLVAGQLRENSIGSLIYVGGHVLCETLNLLNVLVQLGLVCYVLQAYGWLGLIVQSRSQRLDASAIHSFPLHTLCQLHKYGASGDVQRHSVFCIMSINGFMETIFVCQCIWFTLLTVLSLLALLYRLAMLVIPQARALRLGSKAKLTGHTTVESVTRKLNMGQWFKLYMLSKNLDPVHTRDIMEALDENCSTTGQFQPMAVFTSDTKLLE